MEHIPSSRMVYGGYALPISRADTAERFRVEARNEERIPDGRSHHRQSGSLSSAGNKGKSASLLIPFASAPFIQAVFADGSYLGILDHDLGNIYASAERNDRGQDQIRVSAYL